VVREFCKGCNWPKFGHESADQHHTCPVNEEHRNVDVMKTQNNHEWTQKNISRRFDKQQSKGNKTYLEHHLTFTNFRKNAQIQRAIWQNVVGKYPNDPQRGRAGAG
jgi:hypothetical protein